MYGLHFREELEEPTAREFDALVSKLKGFLLAEHNEDGTHNFDLTTNRTLSQTTINQLIAGAQANGQQWLAGPWVFDDPNSATPHAVALRPPDPTAGGASDVWQQEIVEYTGNGADDRTIATSFPIDSGVVAVWVYKIVGSGSGTVVVRTSAGSTNYSETSGVDATNGLKSFSSAGFVVGTNSAVNASGESYVAIVLRDTSSGNDYMRVGTYAGTGAEQTIDVGFQPTNVWALPEASSDIVYRSVGFDSLKSTSLDAGSVASTNSIKAFVSNGFTVGANTLVNGSTKSYGYIALVATDLSGGFFYDYITANTDVETVSTTFTPAFMAAGIEASRTSYYRSTNSNSSTQSQEFQGETDTTGNGIQAIGASSFDVGTLVTKTSAHAQFFAYAFKSSYTLSAGGSTTFHNYAPAGVDTAIALEIDAGDDIALTGLKAIEGLTKKRLLLFRNRSTTNSITLSHESTDSLAPFRFKLPKNRDIEMGPNQNTWLYYDPEQQRWTCTLTPHDAGGLGSGLSAGADETITGSWTFNNNVAIGGFNLTVDTTTLVVDATNDRVGIGTASPQTPLHVAAATAVSARLANTAASGAAGGGGFLSYHDDGAAMGSGDRLGFALFGGARDAASTITGSIGLLGFAEAAWTGTSTPGYLVIETTPSGTTNRSERIRVTAAGLVNIVTDAGLGIVDTNASHYMRLDCGSNLTADRVLSFVPGDAARTITLSGNPTLADWFDQSVKAAASPTFAGLTLTAALTAANGGTGRASHTAYAVICGGTTATAAQQSVASVGTSGQVLTSNGASALPTFQTISGGNPTEQSTTSTGTQDNFNLTSRYTYLRCSPASALTFTGFTVAGSAPTAGDVVIIDCLTSTTVRVAHQDTGSTDVNRARWPSTRGQIITDGGRLLLVYDGTTQRWRGSLISPGGLISIAFDANNYSASGSMTWDVESADQGTLVYQQLGKIVRVLGNIANTTVGGTLGSTLQITLPNSYVATRVLGGICGVNETGGGAYNPAQWLLGANESLLKFRRTDGTNWSAVTNAWGVRFDIALEVD